MLPYAKLGRISYFLRGLRRLLTFIRVSPEPGLGKMTATKTDSKGLRMKRMKNTIITLCLLEACLAPLISRAAEETPTAPTAATARQGGHARKRVLPNHHGSGVRRAGELVR